MPCCEAGQHLHRFFILGFVESGTGHQHIDGRRFELSAGDAFWIAPGQAHASDGMSGATAWVVTFAAEVLEPGQAESASFLGLARSPWQLPFTRARERGHCHEPLPSATCEDWRLCLTRLARELEERALGYDDAARALLHLLLLDVARRVSGPDAEPLSPRRALLEPLFDFIERNYRRPIGLRDVAKAVGRSPAYLTDMVRRETGRPVLGWIIERRMAEARHLLLTTEAPTEQIATTVGYGDPRHFSRQFRKLNGLPPQAWRRRQLGAARGAHGSSAR